jgi:tetratricopeptide (TPR) repeat protein
MAILAQVCNATGKYDEGLQLITQAIGKNNKRADYHGLLGDMLTTQGNFKGALQAYDKALKLNPTHQGVLAGKANTWLRLNEPEKALKLLAPIIKQGSEDIHIAIVYARTLMENDQAQEAAEILLAHLPATRESVEARRTLYFTLGKAMEKAHEYKSAFEAYTEGNALSASSFDLDGLVRTHDEIMSAFSKDLFSSLAESEIVDDSRVFIVGMLRSGSTLTEQIIDAHPNGEGLGELDTLARLLHEEDLSTLSVEKLNAVGERYLSETSRSSTGCVLVDKQLGNYQHVGLIKKVFPNAKIIHCIREPLSMGLSCYAQKLPPFTNPWASSLHGIGHFYNEYMRLMNHWNTLFGDEMLTVSYEELVMNQEATTRNILEFAGLDFDEKCMEFWKTGRAVLTLSQDQVRKPMYDSSVTRHTQFGELLDPLRDALGD